MPSENADFFDELKEWSERKHQVISKYLDGAYRILSSVGPVHYVDGFAGPGYYGRANEVKSPGSPIRAAQLAQQMHEQGTGPGLRCVNVEIDERRYTDIQAATAEFGGLVTNIHGAFAQSVPEILGQLRTEAAIWFLDPFGVDVDLASVNRLIRRRGITDLWIKFDAGEVRRRAGYFGSTETGADKQVELLCRVYGNYDVSALQAELNASTPGLRSQRAVTLYLERLRGLYQAAKGTGFAEAYGIKSLQGETKYHLVFATASEKGLVLASDVVYSVENQYQQELEAYRNVGQMSMFDVFDPPEDEVMAAVATRLVPEIWQAFCGQAPTRLNVQAALLTNRFGTIKRPHVNAALKAMVESGVIESKTGQLSEDKTSLVFRRC